MRVVSVIFIFALISGCSSIDNQILGNWHCENCSHEKNLLILEDNRIFQSPGSKGKGSIQYEYDILDKGLIELNRVNPFFLFRWLRELYCVFTTCEQVFKYKLAKDGTLRIFWNGTEEIYRKVILGAKTKTTESTLSIAETMKFIDNLSFVYDSEATRNSLYEDLEKIGTVKTEKCLAMFTYKHRFNRKYSISIDLGSLNPNSLYGTPYSLTVRTTNNENKIKHVYGNEVGTGSYIFFSTYSKKDTKKVAKALKSVITQCGGKDDLF